MASSDFGKVSAFIYLRYAFKYRCLSDSRHLQGLKMARWWLTCSQGQSPFITTADMTKSNSRSPSMRIWSSSGKGTPLPRDSPWSLSRGTSRTSWSLSVTRRARSATSFSRSFREIVECHQGALVPFLTRLRQFCKVLVDRPPHRSS